MTWPLPNGKDLALRWKRYLYVSDSHSLRLELVPTAPTRTVGEGSVLLRPRHVEQQRKRWLTNRTEKGNLLLHRPRRRWGWCRRRAKPPGTESRLPAFCPNVCFGGDESTCCYITCSKKVYSLKNDGEGRAGGDEEQ